MPLTGEQIKKWRKERGLSQEDLAKKCHVSISAISSWESGRHEPHGAAATILEDLIYGRIALIQLTPQEERLLAENMARGGFKTPEEFLTRVLLDAIQASPPSRKAAPSKQVKDK